MTEIDEQSRLRRYLAAYERLCKKYNLMVFSGCFGEDKVYERFASNYRNNDDLPPHIEELKEGGINK